MQISGKIVSKLRNWKLVLIPLALVLVMAMPARAESDTAFSFIAIGDTPYSPAENERITGPITQAIREANPPFVVHHGDLKGGGESCSKALLKERRKDIYNLLDDGPVFYTPGDNEWADCDRAFLDHPVSELGQLDLVRRIFFKKPLKLEESWSYASQPNYPENARWMYDGVLFATIHLVSTNNGRKEILLDDVEQALAMVEARDQADRVWLEAAFNEALKAKAKAVVIVTQADPTAADGAGSCNWENRINCDAFESFRANIRLRASQFADRGQPRRPVLLLHGDTNPYCLDKKFGGEMAPNLWRLNAWGDYQGPADATKITVQPDNKDEPFTVITLLGNKLPAEGCS